MNEFDEIKTISVNLWSDGPANYKDDKRIAIAKIPMYRWRYYLIVSEDDSGKIMAKKLFRPDELKEMDIDPEEEIICWSYNVRNAQ